MGNKIPPRDWTKNPPECHECGARGRLTTGAEIYPHRRDLSRIGLWVCSNADCDARVGVHANSDRAAPKGIMATAEHRARKMAAHALFDQLWKNSRLTRRQAYQWATMVLGAERQVHIGWLEPEVLDQMIELLRSLMADGVDAAVERVLRDLYGDEGVARGVG